MFWLWHCHDILLQLLESYSALDAYFLVHLHTCILESWWNFVFVEWIQILLFVVYLHLKLQEEISIMHSLIQALMMVSNFSSVVAY